MAILPVTLQLTAFEPNNNAHTNLKATSSKKKKKKVTLESCKYNMSSLSHATKFSIGV